MIYRPERYSVSTAPSESPIAEPVTAEEAKAQGNLGTADSTQLVEFYVRAARQLLETRLNRALIPKTMTYRLDRFPIGAEQLLELPGGAVSAVDEITYVDDDGQVQTWDSSSYVLNLGGDRNPATISLQWGQAWPSVRAVGLPVVLTYGAGWTAEDCPDEIKLLVKMLAAHMFDNRDVMQASGIMESLVFSTLVDAWKIWAVA